MSNNVYFSNIWLFQWLIFWPPRNITSSKSSFPLSCLPESLKLLLVWSLFSIPDLYILNFFQLSELLIPLVTFLFYFFTLLARTFLISYLCGDLLWMSFSQHVLTKCHVDLFYITSCSFISFLFLILKSLNSIIFNVTSVFLSRVSQKIQVDGNMAYIALRPTEIKTCRCMI